MPEPVFFAAYLKLGNPQELRAREAICQEPSALMGIFFLRGTFGLVAAFVFKPSAVCLQWEFAGIKTGEKLMEFTPGNKRAFVQEDLEDAAAFIAATFISVFSLPKSTCQPCRRRGTHGQGTDTSCAHR